MGRATRGPGAFPRSRQGRDLGTARPLVRRGGRRAGSLGIDGGQNSSFLGSSDRRSLLRLVPLAPDERPAGPHRGASTGGFGPPTTARIVVALPPSTLRSIVFAASISINILTSCARIAPRVVRLGCASALARGFVPIVPGGPVSNFFAPPPSGGRRSGPRGRRIRTIESAIPRAALRRAPLSRAPASQAIAPARPRPLGSTSRRRILAPGGPGPLGLAPRRRRVLATKSLAFERR